MKKNTKKTIVALQIRIGEDLYNEAKKEADRLCVPLNSVLISLIDDGIKYREIVSKVFYTIPPVSLDFSQCNHQSLSQESTQLAS